MVMKLAVVMVFEGLMVMVMSFVVFMGVIKV